MDTAFPRGLLRPGERVLWSGAPAQGLRFTARDLFLVPFSLLWCGFAVTWEVTAARTGSDGTFLLFGALFVGVGLTIMVGRFGVDAWLRARTRYALTDRRAVIERDGPGGVLHSLDLAGLDDIALSPGRAGAGTIRLGPRRFLFGRGNGLDVWVPVLDAVPQFLSIPDARHVFDLIQSERERLGSRSPDA